MKNIVEYINESNTDKIPVKAKNIGKKLITNKIHDLLILFITLDPIIFYTKTGVR